MNELRKKNFINNVDNKKEQFHNIHEMFTEIAYSDIEMLPHRYVFVLTNLCNLKCKFCFQSRRKLKGSMTAEDWIKLARQLPSYARVTMTGGEPLVHNGFMQVFSYIAEHFECNLITNGILLNERKIIFLLAFPNFKVLSISIDNIGNTFREVDKHKWLHMEKMIKYFIKRRNETNPDCVLDIKTLILDKNAGDLLEIHKYCVEELGCDHHSFMLLKGSPIQHADNMYKFNDIIKKTYAPMYKNFEVIKKQLELIRQYNIENGKKAFLHPSIVSLISEEPIPNIDYINKRVHVKNKYLPCKFPWASVHINVDGNLFPCLAISMGNVKKKSLFDIINSNKFIKFRNLIKNEGTVEGCNRCGWLRPNKNVITNLK